jgi:hypothetical protein
MEAIVICAIAIGRFIKVVMEWETFVTEQQAMIHQNVSEFNHISGAIPMMLTSSTIEGYVDFLWLWSATRAYWFFGKVMETDESDERKSIHWKHIYILMYSIEYYAGH